MRVKRMRESDVKKFKIGDQIQLGKYTATAVKKVGSCAIFLMDQYLDKLMRRDTLDFIKLANMPIFDPVREKMVPFADDILVRIPYIGEMFGPEIRVYYEPDFPDNNKKDWWSEQWECMKDRRNRTICQIDGDYVYGWLMNQIHRELHVSKKTVTGHTNFAFVNASGNSWSNPGHREYGIRLVFQLRDE